MIKGFTAFSQSQINGFARGANWSQTALDRQRIIGKEKGFDYGLDMTFVTRYAKEEFPSTIAYITNCNSFTGKNTTYVALELDKPERLRQFSEKTRHRILAILN